VTAVPAGIPPGVRDWHVKVASATGTAADARGHVLYTWDLVLVDADDAGFPGAATHGVAAASVHPDGYRAGTTVHGSIGQPTGALRPRFRRARDEVRARDRLRPDRRRRT